MPYKRFLLIVCTILSVPKTSLNKRKLQRLDNFQYLVDLNTIYLILVIKSEIPCIKSYY